MDRHSMRNDPFSRFHELLKTRGYSNYQEYLLSEAWKVFNQWYRNTNLPQCCLACGSPTFQLHHWTYENIAQDNPCDVIPLCDDHHLELHRWLEKNKSPLCDVISHLQKCFGKSRDEAIRLFSPFLEMKSESSRKRHRSAHRCVDCGYSLAQNYRNARCWSCRQKDWKPNQQPKTKPPAVLPPRKRK